MLLSATYSSIEYCVPCFRRDVDKLERVQKNKNREKCENVIWEERVPKGEG